jgi:methanogenic corrinoid protein MtbC1
MQNQYQDLENAIFAGDIAGGVAAAQELADRGTSPIEIFSECIEPALTIVGDQFSRLEIFLPEMINAAEVVKQVQAVLKTYLAADQNQMTRGRVVIGTVSGDLHDIGKNIVKAMLEVNGFEVKDLGVDVNPAAAVREAVEFDADILAFSALMLPSLPYVKDAIDMIQANERHRERFKVMVGGGPVSQVWAEAAGADGYGDDAIAAVQVAKYLMASEGGNTP